MYRTRRDISPKHLYKLVNSGIRYTNKMRKKGITNIYIDQGLRTMIYDKLKKIYPNSPFELVWKFTKEIQKKIYRKTGVPGVWWNKKV